MLSRAVSDEPTSRRAQEEAVQVVEKVRNEEWYQTIGLRVFRSLNSRKAQLIEIDALLDMYQDEISKFLQDQKVFYCVMESIEDLVKLIQRTRIIELNESRLLRMNIEASLLKDITNTKNESYRRVFKHKITAVEAVSDDDLANYEKELLGVCWL